MNARLPVVPPLLSLLWLGCAGTEPPPPATDEPAEEAVVAEVTAPPAPAAGETPTPTPVDHPDIIPDAPWIRSYGAWIQDRETGEVIVSKKADRDRPMASIAKLMGVLTWLETDPDMDAVVRISRDDAYNPSFTRSPLWIGTSYRAGDLLRQALMESDNRAMAALARSTGMDEVQFAEAMNRKASELGMVRSAFDEPTGISGDNRTTPFEAGLLLEACLAEPVLAEILGSENHAFQRQDRPRRLVAQSTNMLTRMEHWRVIGSKTGYTVLAGSCLVMVAEVEGRQLLMSFMGHPETDMRFRDAGEVRWWLHELEGG